MDFSNSANYGPSASNQSFSTLNDLIKHCQNPPDELLVPAEGTRGMNGRNSSPNSSILTDRSERPHDRSNSSLRGDTRRPRVRAGNEKILEIKNRIFVGGLNKSINEDDLRDLFGPFGELLEVQIKLRGDDQARGYGFVTFKNISDTEKALRAGAGEALSMKGHKLVVQAAYRRVENRPMGMNSMPLPGGQAAAGLMGPSMMANPMMMPPVGPYSPYPYGYPAAFPNSFPYYPPAYYPSAGDPMSRWPMNPMSYPMASYPFMPTGNPLMMPSANNAWNAMPPFMPTDRQQLPSRPNSSDLSESDQFSPAPTGSPNFACLPTPIIQVDHMSDDLNRFAFSRSRGGSGIKGELNDPDTLGRLVNSPKYSPDTRARK